MNKDYAFISAFDELLSKGCTVREALEHLREYTNGGSVSRSAGLVLAGLNKGYHLTEILAGESIQGRNYLRPYLGMAGQTGSILPALALAIADGKRRGENSSKIREALVYPASVTVLLAILLSLLFALGIPWMSESNLLHDTSALKGMKRGVVLAAVFLAASTGIAAFVSMRFLAKKNSSYRFWSLLDCLARAGLTFDKSLELCVRSVPVPCTTDDDGYFFDAPELDGFTRSTLHILRLTGDCVSAFASISAHEKERLDSMYSVLSRIAEPVLLAITGIVMLILTLTVFLPALTLNGGLV